MAQREALRELQTRLSGRLQAARSEGTSVKWLAARIGERSFLFPLAQAGEIFTLGAIDPVPYTEPWFLGVAKWRGGICGVVDFLRFLKAEEQAMPWQAPAPDTPSKAPVAGEASLVTFNPAFDLQCALVVDRLVGLWGSDAFVAARVPDGRNPPWYSAIYTDKQGGAWQEVNLQALSRHPAFLQIGGAA